MVPTVVNTFRPFVQPNQMHEAGFRLFRVEDPQGVQVPGCKSISELRLDGVVIPPSVQEEWLKDLTMKNFERVEVPLYQLVEGTEGPMIIRSLKSNDGNWQVGSVLAVKGEWDGESDGLDEMKTTDLYALSVELGLSIPKVGMKKIDVIAAIRNAREAQASK